MHAAPLDTTGTASLTRSNQCYDCINIRVGKFQSVEWDTTDPARLEVTMRQFNKDELNEAVRGSLVHLDGPVGFSWA